MLGMLEIQNVKNIAGFILKSVRHSKHSQIQDRLPSVLVSCINFSKGSQELFRTKKMCYVHLKIAQMVFLQLFHKQVTSESYCFQFALESIQQAAAPVQAVYHRQNWVSHKTLSVTAASDTRKWQQHKKCSWNNITAEIPEMTENY